ncbi:MAG TPA: AraC family transcriptional regulator [Candidatus Monoglobus merdigallinarum]|uniref:AraC family transcriptional regulator n=1 Tax=Candidatus Monoglobus merdigallinarum TaxID=2838698 RepID=A0A9D1PRE0_9FIRM|nr:AraC family transcriptional regulator [Candidatus Monoglobus merdigallinarum]
MVPFYEIQPSDLSVIHNSREIRFHPHLHKHIEICYVFSEGQHINIENKEYEIKAGQAAIVFPDITHFYCRNVQRQAEEVLVICSPNLFSGLFPSLADMRPENPIITDIDDVTKEAFRQIVDCTCFEERIGWVTAVLSKLLRKVEVLTDKHAPVESLTQKLIQYIGENFKQDISLESLAREFNVSKYYISHIFSSRINVNLRNYLALVRTEYAAGLIRTTSDSITNICSCAGFSSQRTFNRTFKQIYGMTPSEYKRNIDMFLSE